MSNLGWRPDWAWQEASAGYLQLASSHTELQSRGNKKGSRLEGRLLRSRKGPVATWSSARGFLLLGNRSPGGVCVCARACMRMLQRVDVGKSRQPTHMTPKAGPGHSPWPGTAGLDQDRHWATAAPITEGMVSCTVWVPSWGPCVSGGKPWVTGTQALESHEIVKRFYSSSYNYSACLSK